jgi:outer membrane protein assembly factor BamA
MKRPLLERGIRTLFMIATTVLLITPRESFAVISNEYLGEVTVSLEGAKRTKPRYVESLVKYCLEKGDYRTWESIDQAALGQCIKNTKVFESVDVAVTQPEIKVTLSDRWTLIPIPSAYASDGKRSVGAFLFESNFLGIGKKVGAGGSLSTEGSTFSLMYFDPWVRFTDFTLNAIASRSSTELDAYRRTSTIYSYEKKETGFQLSPGYRITPFISGSVSLTYTKKQYSQIEAFSYPDDYASWGVGARLSYSNSDYKLFYNDGFSASISWNRQVRRTNDLDKVSSATARLEWDHLLFGKHALQFGVQASSQSSDVGIGDVATYGRVKGFRGIQPSGLWARQAAAGSIDYQVPIAHWGHGTVTVAPFVDYGTYKPFFAGTGNYYTAYGVGAYYFINLINLPGVGLVAGNNDDFMGTFVTVSIGVGFN